MRSGSKIGTALILSIFVTLGFWPGRAMAEDCTWSGGTGSWHTGGDWSCGHEPGASDTAIIGTGTVTVTSNVTVQGLTQTSGTIDGSGNISVTGAMTWSGGTHGGTGTTTVGSSATLDLSGSTKTLNRDLTNDGTGIWSAGTVTQPFGVTFTNGASGSLVATGSNVWGTNGAGSVFENLGTFNKSSGTTTTMYSVYNNDGTTSVTAGIFRMRGGGSSGGEFTGSGGTVEFYAGAFTLEGSSSVTADNVVFLGNTTKDIDGSYTANTTTISAGTVNFNGSTVTLPNLVLTGGTLAGGADVTVSGSMTWSYATLDGAGTFTIGPSATLELSGSSRTLSRNMTNNGTATWSGGNVAQPFGVTFTNGASGSLSATGSNSWGTNGANSVFDNLGTFNKGAGSNTTIYSVYNNDGTTNVTGGTFRMYGGGSSAGVFAGTGGIVRFNVGSYTLEGSSSVTADNVVFEGNSTKDIDGSYAADTTTISAGTVNFNGSTVTLPNLILTNGTLAGSADVTVTESMSWSYATLDGGGTFTIGPSATLELSGSTRTLNRDMTNNGTATWSGGNITQPFGVTFTNGAGASLAATGSNSWGTSGAGSVFENLGTFNKGAGNATTMYSVYNNDGTTSVTAGTFRMYGGGSSAGNFTGSGGIVRFNTGAYTLEDTSSVTADNVVFEGNSTKDINGTYTAGTTTISAGTVNFNTASVTLANLELTGGTLQGDADVTISDSMTWSYGTQGGDGTTTIDPSATLDLSTSTKTLNRDMTNSGTAIWSGGSVTQPFGVTFTNAASGILTATSSTSWGTSGSLSVFDNLGTFNNTAGSTTTMYSVFNNDGATSVTAGTFRMYAGGSSAGEFTGAGGTVRFSNAAYTLEGTSSVTAENVIFDGSTTTTINGTYSAGNTTISAGVVDMASSSGGAPGSFNLTGGTLIPPPRLEIHGDFVRTYGAYTHTGNTLAFVGGTAQDLTVSSDTNFENIEVGPGTRLIETEVPDRIIVNGTLVNYGTIRKAKPTTAGPMTFGLTAVDMDVTTLGSLTSVRVDRVDCQHADAFGEALTDRHWSMKPSGSGYEVDLTLGHAVSPESNVWLCRHLATASPWDCARTTWDADSITLEGITTLSDFAPGDSSLAGYLMVSGFEYCAKWSFVLDEEGARAKSNAIGAACGGWFELDTMEARADELPRGSEVKPATGRIAGSVFDRASGHPLVGVEVLFASNGVLAGRTKTNREGRYVSPKLAEGTYSVMTHGGRNYLHEQWSGVQCWAAPDPTLGYPVEVNRGRIAEGVDFDLERGARVSGDVIDSESGQAVAGATVQILSEGGNVVAEVLSDGDGRYRTLPLPVGVYTAVGTARSDGLTVTSSPVAVAVGCGPANADLVVR